MRQPLLTAKTFFALYFPALFVCSLLFAQTIYSQVGVNTPWIWKKGPNEPFGIANNGTIGVESASNLPTPRNSGSTFTDINGNLWLFGGFNYQPAPAYHYFNELWKFNPNTNNWTWMKGNSAPNSLGNYGTKGVVASTNTPGARSDAASWVDKNGNFWLFGGDGMDAYGFDGKLNDLWKFDVATNNWVWISGNDYGNAPGNYGAQGVPASNNLPPARSSMASWTDDLGNLWLYGGFDESWDYKADLWRYTIASNTWTWMNGSSATNLALNHGTIGITAVTNTPGGRAHSTTWIDAGNNLYLFGGTTNNSNYYNDLWKYSPQNNQWTWINGNNLPLQPAVMGTQGVAHPQNKPGARSAASAFTDMQGNFWLFGGWGMLSGSTAGGLNDLWKYAPATNQWIWIKGGQLNAYGIYGTQGQAALTNMPGSKWFAMSWSLPSDNFWLFGGLGYGETLGWGEMNDMWNLNSSSVVTSIAAPTNPLNKFTIYPNPASTHIRFTWPGAPVFKASYSIIDVSGRTALQGHLAPVSSNRFSIEISNLPPGHYIVIINSKHSTMQAPFLKQ